MTVIYGASDDLIEIGGEINDEVAGSEKFVSISGSDGTKAKIKYADDGNWRILVSHAGVALDRHVFAVGDDREHDDAAAQDEQVSGYSDFLVFNDHLEWVKVGHKTISSKPYEK